MAELRDQISNQLGQQIASEEVKSMQAKAKIERFNIDGTPITADNKK